MTRAFERALEQVLRARNPEFTWVVQRREDADDEQARKKVPGTEARPAGDDDHEDADRGD